LHARQYRLEKVELLARIPTIFGDDQPDIHSKLHHTEPAVTPGTISRSTRNSTGIDQPHSIFVFQ